MTAAFKREVALSERAPDRDSKVEHLRLALKYRPGHPDNLAAEFQIAVLLSQYWDPAYPQPVKRREAVGVYEHILQTYKHMDHYSIEPVNATSDMQLMMPEAAIHLACLYRGLDGNNERAKELTHFAMEYLAQTCERRKKDWLNIPQPRDLAATPPHLSRLESRIKRWSHKREKAAAGDVFAELETTIAEVAVRQYGYAFGKLRHSEVSIPMGQVIHDFPGTPMAKIAQRHIERAKEQMFNEFDKDFFAESLNSLAPPGVLASESSLNPATEANSQPSPALEEPNQPKKALDEAKKSTIRPAFVLSIGLAVIVAPTVWMVARRRKLRREQEQTS